jgi:hypothetical protein
MNITSTPTLRRNLRRLMLATVIGAVATIASTSVASAVPSPPDESAECHPYGTGIDDCGFYPDPPDDGDSATNSNTSNPDCFGSQGYGWDIIKLTSDGIDFGDTYWSGVLGDPFGSGSVQWSVPNCDFYTATVVGTIHLDGVSGKFGRMHVSYWWDDERVDTRHSSALHAPDNHHVERSVVMSPFIGTNVDEVHVCTEISDDGVDFDTVDCKTRYL